MGSTGGSHSLVEGGSPPECGKHLMRGKGNEFHDSTEEEHQTGWCNPYYIIGVVAEF